MGKQEQSTDQTESDARLLITVEEAARRLSIGRSHIYELVVRGMLRSVRIGRSRRIAARDIEAFIESLLHESPVTLAPVDSWRAIRPVKKAYPERPRRR